MQESETEEGAVPLEDPDFQVGAFPGHVPEEVCAVLVYACLRAAMVFVCSGLETEEAADGIESQAYV
jgi:hypothetical protein